MTELDLLLIKHMLVITIPIIECTALVWRFTTSDVCRPLPRRLCTDNTKFQVTLSIQLGTICHYDIHKLGTSLYNSDSSVFKDSVQIKECKYLRRY